MIIVLDQDATERQIRSIESEVRRRGNSAVLVAGRERSVIAVVGPLRFDPRDFDRLPGVSQVVRVSKPYKLASREVKRETTIVRVGDIAIGGDRIVVMAGPCSVEGRPMLLSAAQELSKMGVPILRGGAYKPRTSPYSFQGLGEEGLKILAQARAATGMKIITEVMAPEKVALVARTADILQIGARNMQNFDLLKACAEVNKPVLLKRGFANTIEEWLMAAEYILARGKNPNVILCERGIRTFETSTRNTLDLNAIPVVKSLSHLPVVVDPSHGVGVREYIIPLALAAVASGADGLIVEAHPEPEHALSDGPQSLYMHQVRRLLRDLEALCPIVGRQLELTNRVPIERTKASRHRGKRQTRVGYQGVPGAFSERAVVQFFGVRGDPVSCTSFAEVFEKVVSGELEFGVLPIENTLGGSVHPNDDLLQQYDVQIVGEMKMRIIHCLIAHRGTDESQIKTLYVHPQAAAQCDRFLRQHRQWVILQTFDTAGSVKYIKEKKLFEAGAVASHAAAQQYDMEVLVEGIEDDPRNYTRFLLVARPGHMIPGSNKVSLSYTTPHQPGALHRTLAVFAREKLNLMKLQSRPIPGRPWEYRFYVDLEGALDHPSTQRALKALAKWTTTYKILGCYPSAP